MITASFPVEAIAAHIHIVRGHKVIVDAVLANLYGVPTKALIQAVRRNLDRFPQDSMFPLTEQEVANLRSQTVTSSLGSAGWGGRRWATYVFTEQGVAMLSSVLRGARAISVNIAIMRTFVRLRQIVGANAELAKKLDDLERRISGQDQAIKNIVHAIRELAAPSQTRPRRPIGFVTGE